MKILYVSSEAFPFCKTGGLADVAGSLPPALARNGDEVSVILPLYGQIGQQWRQQMTFRRYIYVDLGWRHQYCGLFSLERDGVTWYFVDNEHYFCRGALYGEFDDGERFAFFCKAVIDLLPSLDWMPDILHCNDWQTALVPIYLKDVCTRWEAVRRIRTVFTIHNIEYQGRYGEDTVDQLFGLDRGWYNDGTLQMDGDVNLMKGAMLVSDAVTTVSPTYANEIKTAYFGEGLEGILDARSHELSGIINGIDTKVFNPYTDPALPARYNKGRLNGKKLCKLALQRDFGLEQREDVPVFAMVTRMTEQKGFDLVECMLDELMQYNDMQFFMLGSGDKEYENFMREAEARYKGRLCAYIGYNEELSHRVYAGADFLLMPSRFEPCGLSQMIAMRYGTLPIVRETGGLKDSVKPYNKFTGEGTGFSFADFNAHEMKDAMLLALECYHKPEIMSSLVRQAMEADFSFDRSSEEYAMLYLWML